MSAPGRRAAALRSPPIGTPLAYPAGTTRSARASAGAEAIAAEEAQRHPRPGRGVGLPALHRVPDRLARVGGRPDAHVASRRQRPVLADVTVCSFRKTLVPAIRARLARSELAPEIIFFRGRQSGVVSVPAAAPYLNGLVPNVPCRRIPDFSASRQYSVLSMLGCLAMPARLPVSQSSPAGELVVRRQAGMGLALPLELEELDTPAPSAPALRPTLWSAACRHIAALRTSGRSTDCRCAESPAPCRRSSPHNWPATPKALPGHRWPRSSAASASASCRHCRGR